jgi:hypothetical protein
MERAYSQHPEAIRKRAYLARVEANGGPLGPSLILRNTCLVEGCGAIIPVGCTVCGPEHGAILTAQFDTWRANGGPANVFGRYRATS